MRTTHVERANDGRDTYLVFDDEHRPRFVIAYRPQILLATGETLLVWVVDHFAIERWHRHSVAR